MSSYFFRDATAGSGDRRESRPELSGQRTALPNPPPPVPATAVSSSDHNNSRPPSTSTADISPERPIFGRAATTLAAVHVNTDADSTPTRPSFESSEYSTTEFVQTRSPTTNTPDTMDRSNPGIFRRATQAISQHLELGEGTSYAHRNAPQAPSHWTEHTHKRYLLKLWDSITEAAANTSRFHGNSAALLAATQETLVNRFPELGRGDVTLTKDWIEYVLGVALRHPFCTQDRMGRWELLASSGGARATWGPW